MHFSMTSRRSMPASRASSVGVRWIAISAMPPGEVCHVERHGSAFTGCPQCQPAQCRLNIRLDRIRQIDMDVVDPEALREQVAERLDAGRLGGVVAGGDEVDAQLAGLGGDVLARLAGEERGEGGAGPRV